MDVGVSEQEYIRPLAPHLRCPYRIKLLLDGHQGRSPLKCPAISARAASRGCPRVPAQSQGGTLGCGRRDRMRPRTGAPRLRGSRQQGEDGAQERGRGANQHPVASAALMVRFELHPEASQGVNAIIDWYEGQRTGLGPEFFALLRRAIQIISVRSHCNDGAPRTWP